MNLPRLKPIFLFSFLFFSISGFSADYFWIGNSGDWSDLTHWSNSSGGTGSAFGSLPGLSDNVRFDANSFSIGGQTVTVNIDANCQNLDFTDVTNSPNFAGTDAFTITISDNITLVAAMSHSFLGNYDFTGTSPTSIITAAGQTFNQDILINGTGGTWTFADAIIVSGAIGLREGTIDFAGRDVTAGEITANLSTLARTIDFDNSNITVTNAGTVLDLRGNTTDLSVITGTASIDFNNAADITVQTGDEIKTIPNLLFSACTGDVQINTSAIESNTKRITFGTITLAIDGCNLTIDDNTDNSNIKTFGLISLPNNCKYIIGSGDGTGGFSGTNHSIFTGNFEVGNDGEGDIRGRYVEFMGDFIGGSDTDCRFIRDAQFQNDINIESTGSPHIIFDQDTEIAGNLNLNGDARIRIDQDVNIMGNINAADNSTLRIDNSGTAAITTVFGSLNLGIQTIADIGNGDVGLFNLATVSLASEAQIDFDNNTSTTTIGDLVLSSYNIVRFNTTGNNIITGAITSTGSCDIWLWLKSLSDGTQADLSLTNPQVVTDNICQDINCTTANLTDNNGVDLSNNIGITFSAPTSGIDFFWVGNTTGNTKTGTSSTGVNDDWSNPDNWALSTGTYTGSNACIPGAHDNVFFDANSFSSGAGNVDLDLLIQACNALTWTGIPAGCTIDAGLTQTNRSFLIYGNLSLNANVDNQFEAPITFSAHDIATRTITSNGSNFFGNVNFDFPSGVWSIQDDIDMNGAQRADVRFMNGTVQANGVIWAIEDDWTVTNGSFAAGTSTVTFDGQNSQSSRQEIASNGNAFYNLTVNRQANGGSADRQVRTNDPVTINNDLNILVGSFDDSGNQITGSATGQMYIENFARVIIGKDGVSTTFPTNYTTANIDLNERGFTFYNSDITQTISSIPVYGRLYLQNNVTGLLADKVLDGPISINDLLFINDFNHLIDNGFQITGGAGEEIQMEPNSQLTIGNASTTTVFPTNFATIDIRSSSTIIYNSGLDQPVKEISGTGNAQYWHIITNNSNGVGNPVKTLEGNIIVRGDLTINANSELNTDVVNDFSIELIGNWTNNGVFAPQAGLVSFTGTATQTLSSGGSSENFFNFTVNNSSAGGINISDDIAIANEMVFTDGIVNPSTSEVVTISDGANVSGSSDASHVNGKVEKIGNISFDFPIGKNNRYRPISIRPPTIAGTGFVAEYFETDPDPTYNDGALEAPLNHVSSCEYWILDRSNAVLGGCVVTLSWETATSCGVTNLSELRVTRWNGSMWTNEGNGSTTGSTASGTISSSSNISSFSPFTLASISTANPLPIELLSFGATLNDAHVDLNWVTKSESNNAYFMVQKSANGIDFEDLIGVDGAGNSSSEIHYKSIDRSPFTGMNYYRLKQIDFDGTYSFSPIETIQYINQSASIFPNPAKQESFLNLVISNDFQNGTASFYDLSGKLVFQESLIDQTSKLPLQGLSKGIYLLKIQLDEANTETYKVIIE